MPIFAPRLVNLDENEVIRYARAQKTNKSLISNAVFNALIHAKPYGSYNIFNYDYKNSDVFFENKRILLQGNSIKKHLELCEKVAIIAATVGKDIDEEISAVSEKGEYTNALLLDAAATEAVEETANELQNIISREANREGYNITARFSPGYGDFPLEMQEDILKLAEGNKIGIALTPSLMLIPRKSVTAVIGFKRGNTIKTHDCKNCDKTDCHYRKNNPSGNCPAT